MITRLCLTLTADSQQTVGCCVTDRQPPRYVTHPGRILFSYIGHENKPPVFSDIKLQQKSPVVSKSAQRRLLTETRSIEDKTDIEK